MRNRSHWTDITGTRSGRLVAVSYVGLSKKRHHEWLCRCDCGNERTASASALRRNAVKSCGCILTTHRLTKSPAYKSWQMMWQRCTNTRNDNYPRYGAKGITICAEWESFERFLADMGPRPIGTSLDRIDSSGNYEPSNCRWATRLVQNRNTTRSLGFVTLDGHRTSLAEMARHLACSEPALHYRLVVRRRKDIQLAAA